MFLFPLCPIWEIFPFTFCPIDLQRMRENISKERETPFHSVVPWTNVPHWRIFCLFFLRWQLNILRIFFLFFNPVTWSFGHMERVNPTEMQISPKNKRVRLEQKCHTIYWFRGPECLFFASWNPRKNINTCLFFVFLFFIHNPLH